MITINTELPKELKDKHLNDLVKERHNLMLQCLSPILCLCCKKRTIEEVDRIQYEIERIRNGTPRICN